MKKIITALLIAALAVSVCGCTNLKGGSSTTSGPISGTTSVPIGSTTSAPTSATESSISTSSAS